MDARAVVPAVYAEDVAIVVQLPRVLVSALRYEYDVVPSVD